MGLAVDSVQQATRTKRVGENATFPFIYAAFNQQLLVRVEPGSMSAPNCVSCSRSMTRHGLAASGKQRWQCPHCKATKVHSIDKSAKHLNELLAWLLSRQRQKDMPGQGRSFRRRTQPFWELWPTPDIVDEVHHVNHVDGIHLGRKAVVLIARTDKHVLGWYLARQENSAAWSALMSKIAPPDVVITDGGAGFAKAHRETWPDTKVQRCLFHVSTNVRTATTRNPRLPAGKELYRLAGDLFHITTEAHAHQWVRAYLAWCIRWKEFLSEKTWIDNRERDTHERLVKAQRALNKLLRDGTMFTFLDPKLTKDGVVPATNNRIEGGTNTPLRAILRDHRGLSLNRRVKAIFWWCYLNTEFPLSAAEVLRTMPTDSQINNYYQQAHQQTEHRKAINPWGDRVMWSELHHATGWNNTWD